VIDRRQCPNLQSSSPAHRGFTLVEVLLVLALLAIVAAMVWPALQKPFASRRLHSAADEVRTEWCQARVEAMRSGQTLAFRYQVGGDRFHMGPQNQPSLATSPANAEADSSTACEDDGCTANEDASPPPDDKTLPDGIKFFADAAGDDELPTAAQDAEGQSPESMADCWSDPIFFYPDGTTSDARLVLAIDRSRAIRLILRGITGTVTIANLASLLE
jgi:prepilin-type N-terminal cleavage/methylation domain-containing protein